MKSTENINLSTFTNTSSVIFRGCLIDYSASYSYTTISFSSPNLGLMSTKRDINIILSPKLYNAFSRQL